MKIWFCIVALVVMAAPTGMAQNSIDLPEALARVRVQHVQVQAQKVYLQQQEALKGAAKGHPAGGFGYGFEEWGAAGSGVHSLYYNQSFNLPAVAKRRADLQTALIAAGSSQLMAIELQLERAVAQQYQQLLYYKSQQNLNEQLLLLYDSIVVIAQKRAQVGETGQLPLLTTQTAQQQLALQQLQLKQQLEAGLVDLQLLLYDSTVTAIKDSVLQAPLLTFATSNPQNHPLVRQIQQEQEVLQQRREVLQSQWLPQLNVGVQLQVVEGSFPNAAGQLGWTVPLFRKGLKAQLKGNELGQEQLLLHATASSQQIGLNQKRAWQQLQALQQQLSYLEAQVLPTLLLQQSFLRKAYAVGEIDYLNVLQSLQQVLQARQQYLELLLQLNLQWIDYQYWTS